VAKDEQAVAWPLKTLPNYVATTTLSDPLPCQNSAALRSDVAPLSCRPGPRLD
jgi:hypothetical protein